MMLDRRHLLLGGTALTIAPLLSTGSLAQAIFAPAPGKWRKFEITTTISLSDTPNGAQAWVPIPSFRADDWMRPGQSTWKLKAGEAAIARDPVSGAEMLHARWTGGQPAEIVVLSTFSARDRAVSQSKASVAQLTAEERQRYTAPTELLRLDGITKETAQRIVSGAGSDVDKARRIYDWIVDNTFRDPKTRGCGTGDIEAMLKSGNLGGKCADLNALYVGLARAAGLPARDLYGIRVAASAFGYMSLGANSPLITKAQHCRAEVYLEDIGWFPVDPADVRKVVLEEPPGKLSTTDPKVLAARKALFGAWETNWLAYNDAHDVGLPGSSGPSVPFLMYPQAETPAGRLDWLDPDAFRYTISAREISA
ncbi:MAG: transglutaminase-like domain-containing protein [Hyphomicrobiaceae bacterium]